MQRHTSKPAVANRSIHSAQLANNLKDLAHKFVSARCELGLNAKICELDLNAKICELGLNAKMCELGLNAKICELGLNAKMFFAP